MRINLGDQSSVNIKVKGIVIDTDNGNLKFVTDKYLYGLIKEYPSILKEYRTSKRKLADKEKVIMQLNAKY